MPNLNVSIIDDGYPTLETHLSFNQIDDLIKVDDWGSEFDLRKLNIKLVSEVLKWNHRIKLKSFLHPKFYLNSNKFDDDFLIFDWEYNPASEPIEELHEILNNSNSKIFVFTAWDKIDRIPELLDTDAFKPFKEAGRYEILNKNEDKSIMNILENIAHSFQKGEKNVWKDLDVTLFPSKYLIDFDDFWKMQSLLGSSYIYSYLKKNPVINEAIIFQLFENSEFSFFIDESKSILSSSPNQLLESKRGKFMELSMIDTLRAVGMDKMEEAKEKGYVELKNQ